MDLFLIISVLLSLTALFGVINERYLRLPSAIGLMLLAILTTILIALLKVTGIIQDFGVEQAIVRELDLSEVLLNGVLCFMLFSGSAAVKIDSLRENKWTIYTLAIGSTLLGWIITGMLVWWVLGLLGVNIPLAYAFVFGALISPTDPIAVLNRTSHLDADTVGLTKLLTWGGLRGGLALSLPDSPQKALIINMTFAVVVFSILVQGATIGKLFKPEFLKSLLKS